MCDCAIPLSDDPKPAPWFVLPTPANESILAQFNADHLTSDGGLLWLAQADAELGLGAALAACIPEWRRGPCAPARRVIVIEFCRRSGTQVARSGRARLGR